ncbi:hypothetical protein FACS1894160_3230 [Bacteroidia bacterium]|nr:hypothetical protein FACS1894160_3230 [Bacteroidia bacterium]
MGLTAHGQTSLEKAMESINVSINMSEFLNPSQNETRIEVIDNDSVPSATIGQSYYIEPAFGAVAFKAYFHMVHAIIRHKNGEYVVFVEVSGAREDTFEDIKTGKDKIYTLKEIPFTKIRSRLRYGKPFTSISKQNVYDLDLLLTHCPREQAKELFNADVMVMFPINLSGNVYENKYTVCRAIAVAKYGVSFFMFFMLTNDNYKNFDTYLDDFKQVFWFNDKPLEINSD